MPAEPQPVLHIVFARQDEAWVRGVLLPALGLAEGEYVTQSEYKLGEFKPEEIERAVRTCRYTLLVASRAAEIDQWVDFAGTLAQTVGIDDDRPRLLAVTRDFAPGADRESKLLTLAERCKLCLDCRDPEQTRAALAQLAVEVKRPLAEAPSLECPYPGLRMFGEGDPASSFHRIDLFFGRDAEGDAIIEELRRSNRALLVGPSGCGKSSLVNARVLPVLGKGAEAMAIARLRLGPHPDAALRNALHALDPRLSLAIDAYLASENPEQALPALVAAAVEPRRLVHIDQLEQVFLDDADDHGDRTRFFAQLAALTRVPGVAILLSMRADFYGDLMRHPAWDDFKDHRVELAPLRGDALRLAITRPAEAVGVYVESDLVERLVQETELDRAAEALPLLQVALVQLWAMRQWRYLSLASYERIVNGNHHGLEVVLARHADDSMQQLPPPLRPLAHRVLIDLIHLGEGRPDTRRRRSVSELRRPGDARGAVDCVLEHLSERRLIAISADAAEIPVALPDALATAGSDDPDDPARHVDLAHDALISGWPTLAGWIAERRSDLLTQRRLEARPGIGGLLSASELADFAHWITTPTGQELGATKALRALVLRSRARQRLWRWGISLVAVVMLAAANIYWGQAQRLSQADRTMLNLVKNAREDQSKIQKMSGTLRDAVLNSSRELLSAVAATSKGQQRIAWADSMAQADLAFELGELDDARELYQDAAAAAPADAVGGDGAPGDDLQRDRAVSLERLAHLEAASGNLVDARYNIQDAVKIRERLGAADPASADRRRELAAAYDELGDIAVTADNLDDARAAFDKALAARKALAEAHPGNAAWQRELSKAYEKLGDVTATTGDPKDPGTDSKLGEARRWFESSLALLEALARRDPKNLGWQRDLLVVHGKLGEVAASAGNAELARRRFEQARAIAGSLDAADPHNADWQRASLVLGGKLCDAAAVARQLEQATTCYEGVLEKQRALAAKDPADDRLQRDIANLSRRLNDVAPVAGKRDQAQGWLDQMFATSKALADEKPTPLRDRYLRLGDVLVSADQFDEALGWIDRSFATVHALAEADPDNPAWQHDLSVAYDHRGEVQWVAGKIEDARASFNQAYSIQSKLVGKYPTNRDSKRDLAVTLEKLGELDASTNKPEDARVRFEQALEIHTALAAADPEDPDWQQRLAATYEKLSDLDVAHSPEDAGERLDQALEIRAALAAADRANADWQRALSMVQEKQGELAMAAGKSDGARASFDQALAIRRALVKTDPGDDRRQLDLGGVLTKLALIAHDSTAVAQYAGEACIIYSRLRQRGVLEGGLLLTRLMAALEESTARIATLPAL